jgi:hypothetical protein
MTESFSWSSKQQLVYSPVTSKMSPRLAVYNGRVFAAFTGPGGDDHTYYSTFDGTYWSPYNRVSNGVSTVAPSLVVFRGTLWAAMRGHGDTQQIWFAGFDGNSWSDFRGTGRNTSINGSLAIFRGIVYLAFNGMRGNEGIYYTTFDGAAWPDPKQVPNPVASNAQPSLATWSDNSNQGQKLVLAYKGNGDDETLWYTTYDGAVWTPQQPIPHAFSTDGPALVFFRGLIYAVWRGPSNDESMRFSTFNGTYWTNPLPLPNHFASSVSPSLVVFKDQIYAAFKGPEGDNRIWWIEASIEATNPVPSSPPIGGGYGGTVPFEGSYVAGSTPIQPTNAPIQSSDSSISGTTPAAQPIGGGYGGVAPSEGSYFAESPTIHPTNTPIQSTTSSVPSPPVAIAPVDNSYTGNTGLPGPSSTSGNVERKSEDSDDYGLSDIKKGVKKGVAKGKGELAGMLSKFRHM